MLSEGKMIDEYGGLHLLLFIYLHAQLHIYILKGLIVGFGGTFAFC
jgi:hypothetical protein